MAEYYQYKNPGGSVSTYTKEQADAIKKNNPNISLTSYNTDTSGKTVSGQTYGAGGTSSKKKTTSTVVMPQYEQPRDNSAEIERMFEEQKRTALAQLKQAIAASKSKYESQLDVAPDKYRGLRNAVSTNYYKGISPLREALANTGNLNSGMGRQEQLLAATSMQNDINTLNTQQQQYENEINRAIDDLENSGSLQETQIASENASRLMEALIGEGNRVSTESYNRLQDALARNERAAELGYNRSQDVASSLGYANPYAQYVITPDIQAQLAPYANDYAAFIQANPGSWLVPYAQNARFQKMLASGDQFADELGNYRSPEYLSGQLDDEYRRAQIASTKALADSRNTPDAPPVNTPSPTLINNAYTKAQSEINTINSQRIEPLSAQEEQAIINKWLVRYGVSTGGTGVSDSDIADYLK